MKKLVAFAGSNSSTSINQLLVDYVVSKLEHVSAESLRLTDYAIPMYSEDIEKQDGFPESVQQLKSKIAQADGVVISVNEHNGSLSAFFKNILDWLSRVDRNFLEGKKVLLMSTSPGGRGAAGALAYAQSSLPRFGGTIVESFSLASFYDNFDTTTKRLSNPELETGLNEIIASFLEAVQSA